MNKKVIRAMVLTLVVLVTLNNRVKVINAQSIVNESQSKVGIEYYMGSTTDVIDPEGGK